MVMKKSYLLALIIALVATGWIVSGQLGGPGTAETRAKSAAHQPKRLQLVRTHVSRARQKKNEILLLGRTKASRKVVLRAETAGRVAAVGPREGAKLAAGQVILRLAMDDRKARLAEAQALLGQRRLEYQVAKDLSARKFRSETKLAEADAKQQAARAALERIRLDMARTNIRAPFAGTLEDRAVEIGDYLSIGAPVATFIDLSPIRIVAEIKESEIGAIRLGTQAIAMLPSDRVLVGRVSFISRVSSTKTRTFKVEVEADNSDGVIGEGMTARLRLDMGSVKAHFVSPAVLTLSDKGTIGVKSVDQGDRVRFHHVKLIDDGPGGMWLGGLPDEIRLITVGQEFVQTGQQVSPVPDKAQPLSSRQPGAL